MIAHRQRFGRHTYQQPLCMIKPFSRAGRKIWMGLSSSFVFLRRTAWKGLTSYAKAGLFSASVTAFIIEGYAGLMPDPNATTLVLLQQISQQLAGNAVQNQTLKPESFSPTSSALRVNAVWFLSLCLAITCALAAILVQQWWLCFIQIVHRLC